MGQGRRGAHHRRIIPNADGPEHAETAQRSNAQYLAFSRPVDCTWCYLLCRDVVDEQRVCQIDSDTSGRKPPVAIQAAKHHRTGVRNPDSECRDRCPNSPLHSPRAYATPRCREPDLRNGFRRAATYPPADCRKWNRRRFRSRGTRHLPDRILARKPTGGERDRSHHHLR